MRTTMTMIAAAMLSLAPATAALADARTGTHLAQASGDTVLPLPDRQSTTPAPFTPVEPSRPLPAPESRPGIVVPPQQTRPAPQGPARSAPPEARAPASAPARAPAAPQISLDKPERTEDHGSWQVQCFGAVASGARCQIAARVATGNGAQTVLVFALAPAGDGDAFDVQIALPLGFAIGKGVELAIGGDYQANIDVSRCTAQGCLIEGRATPQLITAMRRGRDVGFKVRTPDDQVVQIPLSLQGFTAALERLAAEPTPDAVPTR